MLTQSAAMKSSLTDSQSQEQGSRGINASIQVIHRLLTADDVIVSLS